MSTSITNILCIHVCEKCGVENDPKIQAIQEKLRAINLSEIVATDAETRRFLSLPEAIRERILALIYELNKQHACCKFQASMDLQLRRTLAKKYHALKKDLVDLGMDEDDTIMLRIRKEHLQFQQKMLSGDFISLQLDFSHMFEVCTAEEASTSK